jgi:DNA-binding transcriptional MerR regulator
MPVKSIRCTAEGARSGLLNVDSVESGGYVSGVTPEPADLSTGDLARATGNTVRTIRFYEEEGLLTPAVVSEGGHRRYTAEDLERLGLITDLRELGLSLCEIRSLLDLRAGCQSAAEFALRFQEVLEVHLEQAQRRLERLTRVKKELLDGLAAIQERLASSGTAQCPCAVAEAASAPRIVKVLARQQGCCGHHPDPGAGPGAPDVVLPGRKDGSARPRG